MFPGGLKPNRLTLALLAPAIAFLLLEPALEPVAVARALPGLSLWGVFIYLATVFTLSLYRYHMERRGPPGLWAGVALVGFFAGYGSACVDLVVRGFTVDYLGFAGLVVADLKDFYIDVALAAFFAAMAEEWETVRRMSIRQTVVHLAQALALSAREVRALFRRG